MVQVQKRRKITNNHKKKKEKNQIKKLESFFCIYVIFFLFSNMSYLFFFRCCISMLLYFNRIMQVEKFVNAYKRSPSIVWRCCSIHPIYACLRAREDRTCFFKRLSVLFPLLIYLMMKVAHVHIHIGWECEKENDDQKKNFFCSFLSSSLLTIELML
jgi:hypothetical protein